ncbi:MAG: hypothetical protein DRP45_00550 [Candidatus Zixiibacteriota bacterium]|nr:MAG: hypothetical protein DRP45_00550 [candidate division Zixibacteria bacterium]
MRSRFLIIRFGSLGDVVLTSATVLNLKINNPNSELVYLTKERFRRTVEMFDGVDEVVTIPNSGSIRDLMTTLMQLDNRSFSTVIDLHGNPRSWFTRKFVAADSKCIYPKRRHERQLAVRKKIIPSKYPHTIDSYNDVVRQLGQYVFCQRPLLRSPAVPDEISSRFDTSGELVVLAPGAAHATKQWPADRFAETARQLHDSRGVQIVWAVTSVERESTLAASATLRKDLPGSDFIELTDCPLEHLAAVLGRANLTIANDSGVAHLSSAAGTPVVAVFGPTHPILGFRPRGLDDTVVEVDEPCRPCSLHGKKDCYRDQRYCLTLIAADEVAEIASGILDRRADNAPALFVDRDGTLIVEKNYLSDPDQVELESGTVKALLQARDKGYRIVVVSNQSGVARGYFDTESVEAVNRRLLEILTANRVQVDGVYFCVHHRDGVVPEYAVDCECRKPAPGMAEKAAVDLGIDLRRSVVVGDSLADINLGRVIGGRSVLVRTGYGAKNEIRLKASPWSETVPVCDNLLSAVQTEL